MNYKLQGPLVKGGQGRTATDIWDTVLYTTIAALVCGGVLVLALPWNGG